MKESRLFKDPIRTLNISDVLVMPELQQQQRSLTPLEKMQIGILITAICPQVVVETGVWSGRTTRFLSDFLTLNGMPGTIYGFDLPDVIDELVNIDPFFTNTKNVEFIKGRLPGSLEDWLLNNDVSIDFALIDAYHSYYAVYSELSCIAPRLSPEGYIFCHDYGFGQKASEGVICGVNDFAKRNGFTVLPLWSNPPSPKTDRSTRAAILYRNVDCDFSHRVYHLRQYARQRYPKLAKLWIRLRGIK